MPGGGEQVQAPAVPGIVGCTLKASDQEAFKERYGIDFDNHQMDLTEIPCIYYSKSFDQNCHTMTDVYKQETIFLPPSVR